MKRLFAWLIESNISAKPSYYTGEHNQHNNPIYSCDIRAAKQFTSQAEAKTTQTELKLPGKTVEHGFGVGLTGGNL